MIWILLKKMFAKIHACNRCSHLYIDVFSNCPRRLALVGTKSVFNVFPYISIRHFEGFL